MEGILKWVVAGTAAVAAGAAIYGAVKSHQAAAEAETAAKDIAAIRKLQAERLAAVKGKEEASPKA